MARWEAHMTAASVLDVNARDQISPGHKEIWYPTVAARIPSEDKWTCCFCEILGDIVERIIWKRARPIRTPLLLNKRIRLDLFRQDLPCASEIYRTLWRAHSELKCTSHSTWAVCPSTE